MEDDKNYEYCYELAWNNVNIWYDDFFNEVHTDLLDKEMAFYGHEKLVDKLLTYRNIINYFKKNNWLYGIRGAIHHSFLADCLEITDYYVPLADINKVVDDPLPYAPFGPLEIEMSKSRLKSILQNKDLDYFIVESLGYNHYEINFDKEKCIAEVLLRKTDSGMVEWDKNDSDTHVILYGLEEYERAELYCRICDHYLYICSDEELENRILPRFQRGRIDTSLANSWDSVKDTLSKRKPKNLDELTYVFAEIIKNEHENYSNGSYAVKLPEIKKYLSTSFDELLYREQVISILSFYIPYSEAVSLEEKMHSASFSEEEKKKLQETICAVRKIKEQEAENLVNWLYDEDQKICFIADISDRVRVLTYGPYMHW